MKCKVLLLVTFTRMFVFLDKDKTRKSKLQTESHIYPYAI